MKERIIRSAKIALATVFSVAALIAEAVTTVYVDDDSTNPVSPYNTPETAAKTITDAMVVAKELAASDAVVVSVAAGEYRVPKLDASGTCYVLDAAISVVGETGDPADVIIHDNVVASHPDYRHVRAFELNHPDARVEALTIDGLGYGGDNQWAGVQGGHILLSDGTVENCIVSGGSLSSGGASQTSHGANVALTGGRLVRCQILNGVLNRNANYGGAGNGSGVYAAGGTVESCLISQCSCRGYTQAALYLGGAAVAVNCTVVDNAANGNHPTAGVWIEGADAKVVNTVIFGNGGTSAAEFGTKNLANYDTCASSVENTESESCLVIDGSVFENVGAGNYHLAVKQGGLADLGTEEGLPAGMSEFDLDGKDRVSGEAIDIGCYELQQKGLTVSGGLSKYGVLAGESLTCSARVMGAKGDVTYKWDFGNGDVKETADADYDYAFPGGGQFFVSVAASDDGGETWSDWVKIGTSIAVAPAVIYVDFLNESPKAPYATEETAATSIEMALLALTNNVSGGLACVDGARICVLPGEYTVPKLAGGGSLCILNAGVKISGKTGDPADVTIHDNMGGQRAFELNHSGAKIEALTIDGEGYRSGQVQGGHVLIADGTVENCTVCGGSFPTGGGYASKGANVALTGGRLVRCQILNGSQFSVANWSYAKGSGVYASDGVVESCLISKCKCTGDYASAALYLEGTATAVNCTVVGNTSASSLEGFKSAGVSVESADAKVVNTVIFNNGGTSDAEFGTKNLANYDTCASSVENAASESCLVIDGSVFEDAANENYHLAVKQGGLLDAGSEDGLPEKMSEFDLDGNDRVSGKAIDIGCYELPQGEFTFTCAVAKYGALENESVACSSGCAGAKGEVLYKWDFGNGDVVTTADEAFGHAYPSSGRFEIRVAASDDGGTTWTDWKVMPTKIVVAPRVMYVDFLNESPEYPYTTEGAAATSIEMALSALTNNVSGGLACVDGVRICVLPGEYTVPKLASSGSLCILNAGVTISGKTGDPADVIIHDNVVASHPDYRHVRAFELNHPDARVEALTIDGLGYGGDNQWAGVQGGHILLSDGTVENCIVSGGSLSSGGASQTSHGANVALTGGRLVRCQILNGVLSRNANYGGSGNGSGVYAAGGTVESCLISQCTCRGYTQAALYLGGAAVAVNCTVVDNAANGNHPTAGVWIEGVDAKVVNTVIFGNGGTSDAEFGTKNLANYIYSASSVENSDASGWQVIDESAFRNYAGAAEDIKGLRPRASGPLVATGSTREEYQAFGATATLDLLGKPRFVGNRLDIGCFEVGLKGLLLLVQ